MTLTGAPGCGKTLVARHTANGAGSVAWVTGHQHSHVDSLVTACLDALDAEVAPGDSPTLALKRALDGRQTLVVLDGVDAIEGLGELLNDLIEDAEDWRLLCTATTVAGRAHEQVLRLPPLPVPMSRQPLEGPAIELLLARVAAAGGHSIDLGQHDGILRGLLRASGGLPSLIEQLAVQIALVGVSDVSPADTLADAVRASYDLLDPEQQECFRRLALIGRPVGPGEQSVERLLGVAGLAGEQSSGLAHGGQQVEPPVGLDLDQAPPGQGSRELDRLGAAHAAHVGEDVEADRATDDGQPTEALLLRRVEQVVGDPHGVGQGVGR